MFAVVVTLTLKSGEAPRFMPHMLANAAASLRDEPDCCQFDVATDPDRPEDVFLYELYKDAAAFDVHLKTAHFISFDAATRDMIASKSISTYAQVAQ